ncbi:hypothetical protein BABINDRAFT_58071 [Babjeviella inositovora NRRL Y-12698]|uniref:Restriction of telomere capping protein 5 n=1 Tax=Babjeviella inositovora NRRL Y-12698 TaxID=984486 RepID=A0A1E3QVD2_9ASCO|nr:uncharacterized protein BABINDRAFT_58071 [Babjeviella inositovora NRRL Y-12698]ODQ81584.1 hypothetical protein BABINDRAFT_58071 [Babjeviella inositovora NRRL Y-12698]
MGGAISQPTSAKFTKENVLAMFDASASRQFSDLELYSIKEKLTTADLDANSRISENEFLSLLGLPTSVPEEATKLLYESARVMGSFPFLRDSMTAEGLTLTTLFKAILFYSNRYQKVISKQYDITRLLFISLSYFNMEPHPTLEDKVVSVEGKLSWSSLPVVESFDSIDMESWQIPASYLLKLITLCLTLSRVAPHESFEAYHTNFSNWKLFEAHAMRLLFTMDASITPANFTTKGVSYEGFANAMTNSMPNLFHPLKALFEHLLYVDTVTMDAKTSEETKLINPHTLAQLATFLPPDLVYSRMRKLYVAADSGFSMRSFESKVFKWNAPSILIVAGKRINPATSTNKRYMAFEETLSRLNKPLLPWQGDSDRLIFGVVVQQPWKMSNKNCFGDSSTLIFQLSTKQDLYEASLVGTNYVYFSTLGGGIGFGSPVPVVKNNTIKYTPGNVSLTLDPSLEFGVFRHAGLGGSFHPGKALGNSGGEPAEWEDRFAITDLEVWGCGGKKELEEQAKQWEWEEKEAKARQKINIKNLGEERAFLEMTGLVGQHNSSGGSI